MKEIITQSARLLFVLVLITQFSYGQIDWKNTCGTIQQAALSVRQPDTIVNGDSVIIVPTVFHVLTQGGAENISKSHVQRALEILNKDFNRQNADTIDIPVAFHPLRGNPKVEFRLARFDPQGNCTDGIDRIYSTLTYGTGGGGNHFEMQPNFDWDHTHYINIYVVHWLDLLNNANVYGASYIPPVDSGQNGGAFNDALTVPYFSIGDGFNGVPSFWRGHNLSHEMGHDMGLLHTFGSGAGCSDDDDVADTPLQDDANRGCPAFPHISCNNGPDGEMFNNFMDYTECKNMFSEGQVDRMRTCLTRNDWRKELWTPSNLLATGVDSLLPACANPPVADFGYGNYVEWLCAGKPVQFYEAATWNPTSYQWEFSGGIPATSTDTFPSVIFPDSGIYSVRLIVSNSLGTDTVVKMIRIKPAEVSYNTSFTESFEDSAFNQQIPSYNLMGKKWAITNLAAYSGSNSIRLDSSLQYFSTFFTHIYDINQVTGINRKLEFKVALGLSAAGSIAGGLRISWKRPCSYERLEMEGVTMDGIETGLFHTGDVLLPDFLKTVTTNVAFIPNDTSQWKTITLDIPDSLTGEIQIGFLWANFVPTNKLKGFYIDDIKVMSDPNSIEEELSELNWNIFPNPASNQLAISLPNNFAEITATISDITGKIIYKATDINSKILVINTSDFAEGVYLVQIQTEKFIETKKVIVAK